ncbi:bifunctional protein TilS/HprT [Patescibacteria group bacterium]|nr:bifunctional protein TilS/HprT [Patescibacteria group bacterium]
MTNPLSAEALETHLKQYKNFETIYVGYSGGADSHVLLHLCTSSVELINKVVAVHVHHGLQKEADFWAEHCQKIAQNIGIDFKLLRVDATANAGESPEEAARNARYAALKPLIGTDDALLIAQHRDDQLETVLLQLFRGAGLRGLSGIPESMPFGQGLMLRPLLNVSKADIDDYAKKRRLNWVEDPSNQQNDLDRNYLRNVIIPQLKERWVACDKTVARSARHCAEAQLIVSAVAEELFYPVFDKTNRTLNITRLCEHKIPRQQLIIRHWFQLLGFKMPSQIFVERIQNEVIGAKEDAEPMLSGQGFVIRRYRDNLYCLRSPELTPPEEMMWVATDNFINFTERRRLFYIHSSAGIPFDRWQKAKVSIKFRNGGEKIRLPNRKERHTLKKLFQEAGIPPWERDLIPLIYMDNKLAAVGDLWISADFYQEKADSCIYFGIQNAK